MKSEHDLLADEIRLGRDDESLVLRDRLIAGSQGGAELLAARGAGRRRADCAPSTPAGAASATLATGDCPRIRRLSMRPAALARCAFALMFAAAVALAPASAPAQVQPAAPSRNLAPGFAGLKADDRLLLMPIDVELFSLSMGGVPEPRADWTEKALANMVKAIDDRRREAKLQIVELKPDQAEEFAEQAGLHAAVAQSIALHQFGGPMWALPTKQGRLDWSFGDAMRPLQTATGAHHALFVWVRDSYASPERVAAMIALAVLGIGVSGGVQVGYASLVDLHTGQVLWFNQLVRGYGDLREPKPARESIDALLTGFPGVQ